MFVEVLLDQALSKRLDYAVPDVLGHLIEVGMRVEVPLKNTLKKGTIVEVKQTSQYPNVRPISRVLSKTAELTDAQWKLAQWMARYYAAPLQRVLRCFIPPNVRRESQAKLQIFVSLNQTREASLKACEELRVKYPIDAAILEVLLQKKQGSFSVELAREFPGGAASALQRLLKKKILSAKKVPLMSDLLLEEEFFKTTPKTLNGDQSQCLQAIQASLLQNKFATHLIHGVTGSGKTEIYLQAIASALEQKKSTIFLVPEISLTSQIIERFRSRFSEKIAILHHKRTLGERSLAWEDLRTGKTQIAIGARSAIFAPLQNLGLIIVDEEHDSSYKQSEETPCYHARNVAIVRAQLEGAVAVLGSATPSIESRYNVDIGKYKFHSIPFRATAASLPVVRIVDMKKTWDAHGGFTHFSEELLNGIQERLKIGEQILLFLNQRGYHRLQICASCRSVVKCPHCDLGLTYHRAVSSLRCHLCDFKREAPRQCPGCGSSDSLQFKGFGTEHAERALHAIFSEIRTLRMDRDTTRSKEAHETLFKQFRSQKADVLIGTQMIAKGFHFPSVTLVGVLNADAPLNIPDFRSSESTFQLLTQVAGRSGRADLPGEVIVQTFLPEHPILKLAASQDYSSFYAAEIKQRQLFSFPPFNHLIKCLFLSPDPRIAEQGAIAAHEFLSKSLPPFATALLPGPSGYPKIKDQYRFQFLIKTAKIDPVTSLLQMLPATDAQVKIDIDPLSTFF